MKHLNVFALLVVMATVSHADTWTWTNSIGGNISTALNWNPSTVPASATNTTLLFNKNTNYNVTNDISPGMTLNRLTFNVGLNGNVNLSGSNLFFASDGATIPVFANDNTHSISIANNLYTSNSMVWYSIGDTTLGGTVVVPNAGTVVTKHNPGRVTLSSSQTWTNNFELYIANGTIQARSLTFGTGFARVGYNAASGNTCQLLLTQPGDTYNTRIWFGQVAGTTNIVGGINTSGTVYFNNWNNAQSSADTKSVYLTAASGGTVDFNNPIIGNCSLSIVKIGSGTVRIKNRGANNTTDKSYSGSTTVRAGTLVVTADADGTGGNGNGGSLGYNNNTIQLGDSLTQPADTPTLFASGANRLVSHPVSVNAYGACTTIGGNDANASTFSGTITLNTNACLTAASGGSATFSGQIAEGSAGKGIIKTGAGTVILSGTNTYTGVTTVSNGTFKLGSGGSISNSALIHVASSTATVDVSAVTFPLVAGQGLSGIGTVNGTVNADPGSRLFPGGSNSVGTLTVSNLVMSGNSILYWDCDTSTGDLIRVPGTLTLPTAATVNVSRLSGSITNEAVLMTFGTGAGAAATDGNLAGWMITGAMPNTRAVVRNKQVKLITSTGMILEIF